MTSLTHEQIEALLKPQYQRDGEAVARFCEEKPQTIKAIQAHLGGVSWNRARAAINWVKEQRRLTENPFVCVKTYNVQTRRYEYLYGYRDQLLEVEEYMLRELRHMSTRMANDEALLRHILATNGSIAKHLTASDRRLVADWVLALAKQSVLMEQARDQVERALTETP
jgi:hypothetical protein